jgi:hypothetical protein
MKKDLGPLEHDIQVAYFQWWDWNYGSPLAWATPNGGVRHIGTARKLKAEGVRAGVPDVFVAVPIKPYAGLFLEFKRLKGVIKPDQTLYLAILEEQGYKTAVVRSVEEAIKTTEEYLGIYRPRRVNRV